MCKDLLDSFAKNQEPTNNPILINTIFDIARTLHDSLDSLSPDGERRHIASLICGFVGKVWPAPCIPLTRRLAGIVAAHLECT